MQFYPGDYLADTMHLSIEEHGAYLKLMFCMWQAGGWLVDNDRDVSRMLGVTAGKWSKIKERIGGYFTYENGKFTQQKLQKTLQKSEEKRSVLKSNGSEGGKAKALKNKDQGLANASEKPKHRTRDPEPEPKYTEDSLRSSSADSADESPPIDFKKIIFDEGLKFLSKATGRKPEALRGLLGKWCKDRGDPAVAGAIVKAQNYSPVDPVSYIEKELRGGSQNVRRYDNQPTKFERGVAAAMRGLDTA